MRERKKKRAKNHQGHDARARMPLKRHETSRHGRHMQNAETPCEECNNRGLWNTKMSCKPAPVRPNHPEVPNQTPYLSFQGIVVRPVPKMQMQECLK